MAAAPSVPPGAVVHAPTEIAAAAPRNAETIVGEEQRRDIVVLVRPEPATFAENPNVKPIYFDFDRYAIRPGDAKTLETDAAWLKTNDLLILIEGQSALRNPSGPCGAE